MTSSRRAAIVGGSVAGLLAALMLRRAGWDVVVWERSSEALSGRGAGIVTHPELWRLMEAACVSVQDLGVGVTRRVVLDRDGAEVATFDCPQVMTAWDRLWRMLREALPDEAYRAGAEVVGVAQDAAGVAVQLADGRVERADLLVGADGIRSSVRAAVVGDVAPDYAGYVAWRGLVEEASVDPALFGVFAFCLPGGEQMLGYPVAGRENDLRPGRRRYNWVWYRPADERELGDLLTDAAGRLHSVSIPPPLIRHELIAHIRDTAALVLAPGLAAVVRATERPLLQPIYDLQSPALAVGRVALIGDAAFVARPHVGAGATKAAEDAAALAAALAAEPDVAAALRRYEALRRPAGERFLRRARHLGAFIQARRTEDEEARAARHAAPEAVLSETAVLTF